MRKQAQWWKSWTLQHPLRGISLTDYLCCRVCVLSRQSKIHWSRANSVDTARQLGPQMLTDNPNIGRRPTVIWRVRTLSSSPCMLTDIPMCSSCLKNSTLLRLCRCSHTFEDPFSVRVRKLSAIKHRHCEDKFIRNRKAGESQSTKCLHAERMMWLQQQVEEHT